LDEKEAKSSNKVAAACRDQSDQVLGQSVYRATLADPFFSPFKRLPVKLKFRIDRRVSKRFRFPRDAPFDTAACPMEFQRSIEAANDRDHR